MINSVITCCAESSTCSLARLPPSPFSPSSSTSSTTSSTSCASTWSTGLSTLVSVRERCQLQTIRSATPGMYLPLDSCTSSASRVSLRCTLALNTPSPAHTADNNHLHAKYNVENYKIHGRHTTTNLQH